MKNNKKRKVWLIRSDNFPGGLIYTDYRAAVQERQESKAVGETVVIETVFMTKEEIEAMPEI